MVVNLIESLRQEILRSLPYDRTRDEIGHELEAMGLDTLVVHFLNWAERLIHPRPRRVQLSGEVSQHALNERDKVELDDTLNRIEIGADLYPQLSTRLVHGYAAIATGKKNLGACRHLDLLLNDWGIHHLHLSPNRNKNSLIFAIFTREESFILDLLPHKQWENQGLVEIAVRNWPDRDLFLELRGVLAPQTRIGANDRKKLRSAGISAPVQVGQRLFVARTGGISTAGTSTRASLRAMRLRRAIHDAATKIEASADSYRDVFIRGKRGIPKEPDFSIKFCNTQFGYGFCLFERQTEIAIPLEQEISS